MPQRSAAPEGHNPAGSCPESRSESERAHVLLTEGKMPAQVEISLPSTSEGQRTTAPQAGLLTPALLSHPQSCVPRQAAYPSPQLQSQGHRACAEHMSHNPCWCSSDLPYRYRQCLILRYLPSEPEALDLSGDEKEEWENPPGRSKDPTHIMCWFSYSS